MKKGKVIRIIILIILATALVISGFKLITTLSRLSGEKNQIQKLAGKQSRVKTCLKKTAI